MSLAEPHFLEHDLACEFVDMAEWSKREHTKGEIDRAGATLVPWWMAPASPPVEPFDLGTLYGIVQNWRTCHGLPLNVIQAGLTMAG